MKLFNSYSYLLDMLIILSVIFCLTVITSTNPVIAIIYLIGVFLSAALYLILIGLGFIGISYILVYIGAITVLFLFIIMMINIDILKIVEVGKEYGKILPLAYSIAIFFFLFFIYLVGISGFGLFTNENFIESIYNSINSFGLSNDKLEFIPFTQLAIFNSGLSAPAGMSYESYLINILQIESLGQLLYSQGAILLLITSFILLLALVTPIILSKSYNTN